MMAATRIPEGAFVRAAGTELLVGGKRFAFVGANFDGIHGDEQRGRLDDVLAAMTEDGITVGRQWVVGEDAAGACQRGLKPYLFRCGPDGFLEETYQQLDRVLVRARERGIRVILTLSNQWGDYGGIPMYLRWAGLPTDGSGGDAFYSDPKVQGFFLAGLDRLLNRVNSVTGGRYIDDPTIFSWELMNESSINTAAGAAARRRWIVEMARYIKARDPNHLVAAGLRGYALQSQRQEWIEVHRLPEVDYCDSHLYPQEESQITSWELLRDFLTDRAHLARAVIRKPLIIGEFGFRTDGAPMWLGVQRGEWVARLLLHVRAQGAAGALVWIYQPFFSKPRDYGIYIDRPYTDDVRRAVRGAAQQVAASLLPRPADRQKLAPPTERLKGSPDNHRQGPGQPSQTTGQAQGRPPA
jgi:mannan endo-1,4-beta-mannosidase